MAIVVGTKTVGAGGNVVSYNQAPNSHLEIHQTESLLIRKDGSYTENNGVKPNLEIAVNESARSKHDKVLDLAVSALVE